MYTRHFRSPLTFESEKFFRGHKNPQKHKVSRLIFGTLLKSLYMFLLMAIDLILFTDSGNLNIFGSNYVLAAELVGLMTLMLAVSTVLMVITSFSTWTQNIICALVTCWFSIVLFNQFAQFDTQTFLGEYVQNFLGSSTPQFLYVGSYIVVSVLLSLLVLWLLWRANIIILACYLLLFAVAFIGILRHEVNNMRNQHDFIELYQSQLKDYSSEDDKKFIYFMLPNLAATKYFYSINDDKAQNVTKLINGFYAKNKFSVFSNSYNEENNSFINMVLAVNLFSNDSASNHILDTMMIYKYWKFFNVNDEYIFLKDNQMFDTFRKAGYKISAYKSRGFDLCHKNHVFNVDRCMEKLNRPVNLYSSNMSSIDRSQVLLIEWISSMKIFKDMSAIYQTLRIFGQPETMPMVGINYNNLYVINSVKTFDIVAEDVINDKGAQAYFVYADIPSDMFVYDEFCNLKPREKWVNMENMPWIKTDNSLAKRNGYLDQTQCLYGKMQEFINKLDNAGLLNKSVIVINGMSSVDDFRKIPYDDFINNFLYDKMSMLAIKSPNNKQLTIDNGICRTQDILRRYIYHDNSCKGLESVNIHQSLKDELQRKLQTLDITEEQAALNVPEFEKWYMKWCYINKISDNFKPDIVTKDKSQAKNTLKQQDGDTPDLQNELLLKDASQQ